MKLPDRNHGIIRYFTNDLRVSDIPAIEILLNLTTQSVIMFAYFLKNTLYRHQGQQGSLTCQQTPSKSQCGTVRNAQMKVTLVIFILYKEKEAVAEVGTKHARVPVVVHLQHASSSNRGRGCTVYKVCMLRSASLRSQLCGLLEG